MKVLRRNLNFIGIIVLTFALAACGSNKTSKDGSSDQSSRGNPETGETGGTGNTPISTGILSECNGIDKDGLKGQLTTYYDPVTKAFVETYIRLQVTQALKAMNSDPNKYVQVFRWFAKADNTRTVNENPTKIYFIQRGTGNVINTNDPVTHLSGSMISSLISKHNLSNVTATNFYDKYIVVLSGVGFDYDAITVATYKNDDSKAIGSFDLLLPAFAADPNEYAGKHQTSILQVLHPLWPERSGGFTAQQFKQMAEEPCQF